MITQTRDLLLDGMRSGRWRHVLPGERLLSEELRVSRWTLRAALSELASQGYLKIDHGRACAITPQALEAKGHAVRARRVALLSPKPLTQLRQNVVIWVDEIRTIFHQHGIDFSIIDSAKAYQAKPSAALKNLVETHPHDGWLLLLSTEPMQRWFDAHGLAAVITGSPYKDVHLPSLDSDMFAAGVHAGRTVQGLGHQRMAFLHPQARTAGIFAIEAGLRSALKQTRFPAENLLPIPIGETKEQICRSLDRLLAIKNPPSALIVARASPTLTVLTGLYSLGRRVPADISLLAIEWDPSLESVVPDIAHYHYSALRFARQVVRSLLNRLEGRQFDEHLLINPDYVPGGSLAKAKRP